MAASGGKMQRVAPTFAFVFMALATIGCMDQGHQDQAMATMDAARREAARDARLLALEREHTFLMQQVATLSASNQQAMTRVATNDDDRDKQLAEMAVQLNALNQTITTWRQDERPQPMDPDTQRIADEGTFQERSVAIRKVQALIDTGRVTITMRGGRIQLTTTRPIQPVVVRPQESAPAKPVPPPPPPKRPVDRLGF
jgi:hypothetical protein